MCVRERELVKFVCVFKRETDRQTTKTKGAKRDECGRDRKKERERKRERERQLVKFVCVFKREKERERERQTDKLL